MSNLVSVLVYHRKFGSAPVKAVAAYMADKASDNGAGVYCSKGTIASETELSRATVYRAIDEMIARGLITEVGERPCKNGFTIVYDMNLSAIFALPQIGTMPEGWTLAVSSAAGKRPSERKTRLTERPVSQGDPSQPDTPTRLTERPLPVSQRDPNPPLNPPYNHTSSSSVRDERRSLVAQLADALGFNETGWPKYWAAPDANLIATRWITDLGLSVTEVVEVAVGSARQHGSPAQGPKGLNKSMADYAAAKSAPALTPTEITSPENRHDRPIARDRRSLAADDAFARRINAAARVGGAS